MEPTPNAQSDLISLGMLFAADGLLDALPWGMLVLDEQHIVRQVNQQAARWCGTSPEALLDQPLAGAALPPAISAPLLRLLEPGAVAREVWLPQQAQWIALSATRQPGGWVLYGQDITPQKQREQQYQALAENTPDVLTRWTPDLRLRYANAAFAAQAGQPMAALLGRTFDEMAVPAEVAGPYLAALQRVFATGQPQEHFHPFPTPQGAAYYSRLVPELRDGQVDTVLGIARDITELKHTEQETQRLQAEAVRHAEDKYRALFDSMAEGFAVNQLVRDEHGRAVDARFLELNSAFEQQTGFARGRAVGQLASELLPAFYRDWLVFVERILRTGQPERFEQYTPDNDRWYIFYITPFSGVDLFAVFYDDITERKRTEAALRESDERQQFLLTLSDALRPLADAAQVQRTAMDCLAGYFGVDTVAYVEFEPDGERARFREGHRSPRVPFAAALRLADYGPAVGAELRAGRTFVYEDTETDPRLAAHRAAYRAMNIRSGLGIPLVKAGRLAVVVAVSHAAPRTWREAERRLAEEVAERTWAAVERARAEEALRRNEQRTRLQKEAFQSAINGEPLANALTTLARMAKEQLGDGVRTVFYLAYPDGASLHAIEGASDLPATYTGPVDGFPVGAGSFCSGLAIETGCPVFARDVREDPLWVSLLPLADAHGFRACSSYPILTRAGKAVGSFALYFADVHEADAPEAAVAEAVTQAAAIVLSRHTEALERANAEEKLRTSEERLQLATTAPGLGVFDWDLRTGRIECTAGFRELTGAAPAQAVTGTWVTEHVVHPDDRDLLAARFAEAQAPGGSGGYRFEHRTRTAAGVRWVDTSGKFYFEGEGAERQPVRVVGNILDITERKQAESALRESDERQQFLLTLSDALRPLADAREIQRTATRVLGEHFGLDRAMYAEITPDGETVVVTDNYLSGRLPAFTGAFPLSAYGPIIERARRGEPLIVADVDAEAALTDEEKFNYKVIGSTAFVTHPLIKNGRWVATLVVHQGVPRRWTTDEIALLREVAERTWAAVERARAEEDLRQSEEKYRSLFESIDEGFSLIELLDDDAGQAVDYRHLEVNPAHEKLTGQVGAVGRTARELMPRPDAQEWVAALDEVARTGETLRRERYVPGLHAWFDVYASRVGGPGSRRVASVFNNITARKRTEANLVLLSEVSEDLAHLTDIDATMSALCAKLGAYFGAAVCAFSPVDEAAGTVAVQHVWHRAGARSPAGVYRLEEYHSAEVRQAMRAGRPEVVRDTADLPAAAADRLAALQVGAFVNLPFVRQGQWLFTLSLAASAPHDWRADELDLLRELTVRIWTRLERARAEDALRHSEEQFRTVANLVPDLLWRSEPDSNTTWYNQRWLDYTGQTLAEAADDGWADALHPDDRERSARQYRTAVQSGQPLQQEHRIRSAGGEYRWFAATALPARDARGTITHWFGAATDIEAHKQAEAGLRTFAAALEVQVAERTHELRESRDLLQSVFDTSLILLLVCYAVRDEHGTIEDFRIALVNQEVVRTVGRSDLVGKRYTRVFPGTKPTGLFDLMCRTVDTGEPQQNELFYPYEDINKWYANTFVKLDDGLVLTSLDITGRKQAEQEQLRTLTLLLQAEAVARLGSWDYDLATGQFLWSGGMYQLFELPPGQPVQPPIYLDYVLDEDRPLAEQLVWQITTGSNDFEVTLRLQVGGEIKTVRIKSVVLRDAQGQAVRVLGVDLDLSELYRLEGDNLRLRLRQQQALFEAVQAAQEAERKRMAESLHNGIGQILYATKLRLDQLHTPMLHTNPVLVAARNEADQLLSEAIRQTRALSHELVPLVLEEFGLAASLQDIGGKMSTPQLRLRSQVVLDDAAAPLAPALQMALYRMAQELAQNIVKHARGATEASLELETTPGWVLLRVEDNGPGFAPAPAGSPGLGLRSIRDRVALLGGQLETGSFLTGGAYVRIRIPLPTPPGP